MANFRSGTVTNTSTSIKTTGADVLELSIVNRHSAVVYVRFYDLDVATFQDTPLKTYAVAASGGLLQIPTTYPAIFSSTLGLCVRVATGATDNDNTAAATLPVIELQYK